MIRSKIQVTLERMKAYVVINRGEHFIESGRGARGMLEWCSSLTNSKGEHSEVAIQLMERQLRLSEEVLCRSLGQVHALKTTLEKGKKDA